MLPVFRGQNRKKSLYIKIAAKYKKIKKANVQITPVKSPKGRGKISNCVTKTAKIIAKPSRKWKIKIAPNEILRIFMSSSLRRKLYLFS
jgi:hypothetical protein